MATGHARIDAQRAQRSSMGPALAISLVTVASTTATIVKESGRGQCGSAPPDSRT
jgi:hypothetical protein